jgi:O-antigen ligase
VRDKLFVGLCALTLVACLLLGGGTTAGFLSDVALQLLSVPLLLVALWRLFDAPAIRQARWALLFCLAVVLVPLLQVIPLPPGIWTALPGRELVAGAFKVAGRELTWLPISVSPHATWVSVLSLVPPVAMFLGTLLLTYRERRQLSLVLLAIGIVSVFVGLNQVAEGPGSALRFFEVTNPSEAVGFFANRNHFAALLYAVTLFAAAWAANAAGELGVGLEQRRYDARLIVPALAGFTVMVALVAAQAMARSRAGLGLAIVALFGALAIALADRRTVSGFTPVKFLLGTMALAGIFVTQFALYRVAQRFTSDPLEDARITFARRTFEAAQTYMPFGSGMGTFPTVYAAFEKPSDTLANTYANRAHNDVLELWLEAGVVGLALLCLFLIWLAVRLVKVWRGRMPGASEIDRSLARAATIVALLIVAHSFVDYPLRAGAMMAIMALACALPIAPLSMTEGEATAKDQHVDIPAGRRPVSGLSPQGGPEPAWRQEPSLGAEGGATRPAGERWGKDVEWPKEWRQQTRSRLQRPKAPADNDVDA